MPMKNPCHPGRLIKADIDALGLSIVDAMKLLARDAEHARRLADRDTKLLKAVSDQFPRDGADSSSAWPIVHHLALCA